MDFASHQFMAGAGLAADDDVRRRLCSPARIGEYPAHRGRRGENREFKLRSHWSWGQRVQQ
jgi:hypothetical protein